MQIDDMLPAIKTQAQEVNDWQGIDRGRDALNVLGAGIDFSSLLEFPNLKYLWIAQANQRQLEIICRLSQLERLYIDWMRSIVSLEPLANLKNLQLLCLQGNMKEVDLEPLGRLPQLRSLYFGALMSTWINGGRIFCKSFAPLANLKSLEYLELSAIQPRDGSIEPLTQMQALRELRIHDDYSLEDYARLAVALPNTNGLFRTAYRESSGDEFTRCKKCGQTDYIVLFGRKRRTFICPHCDQLKFREHIDKFEELKQKFSDSN